MDNKLLRKPKKSEDIENKYEFLGLTQNPFPVEPAVKPYSADPRVNGSIFLEKIREEEIKDFKDHNNCIKQQLNILTKNYKWY